MEDPWQVQKRKGGAVQLGEGVFFDVGVAQAVVEKKEFLWGKRFTEGQAGDRR